MGSRIKKGWPNLQVDLIEEYWYIGPSGRKIKFGGPTWKKLPEDQKNKAIKRGRVDLAKPLPKKSKSSENYFTFEYGNFHRDQPSGGASTIQKGSLTDAINKAILGASIKPDVADAKKELKKNKFFAWKDKYGDFNFISIRVYNLSKENGFSQD